MKQHTSILLDTATRDLGRAKKDLPDDPANAASQAQQCSEKAVKAVVFELGDYEDAVDFDKIGRMYGHDSTRACLAVIRTIIVRLWKESGFEQTQAHFRSMMKKGDKGAALAYLLASQAQGSFSKMLSALDDSRTELSEKYWYDSLDPNLSPRPALNQKWSTKATEGMEMGQETWNIAIMFLGLEESEAHRLFDPSTDLSKLPRIVERIAEDMQNRGMAKAANQFRAGIPKIVRFIGPEFISWLKLVITWTPYLDVHAEKGRYYDAAHLEAYRTHLPGVRNLVSKAEEILKQTRTIIPLLSGVPI